MADNSKLKSKQKRQRDQCRRSLMDVLIDAASTSIGDNEVLLRIKATTREAMSNKTIAKLDYEVAETRFVKAISCPVCFKPLKEHKVLPNCRHSVCQNCLAGCVSRTATLSSASSTFTFLRKSFTTQISCPRCGVDSNLESLNGIESFDSNTVINNIIQELEPSDDNFRYAEAVDDEEMVAKSRLANLAPGEYFKSWHQKPITLFKASSSIVKIIVCENKTPTAVICFCLDGSVLGIPAFSLTGRISWKGRVYVSEDCKVPNDIFGLFHVAYDSQLDCVYVTLMSPHGDKGVFWTKLGDIVLAGVKSGTQMHQLIKPGDMASNPDVPRNFLGLCMNSDRRILYACHADSTDISLWNIETVKIGKKATPQASFLGVIKSSAIPGLSLASSFKASFCSYFTEKFAEDNLVQKHLVAVSNMWDSNIFTIVCHEQPDDQPDRAILAIPVALREDRRPKHRQELGAVDRPRDLLFDKHGNLFATDHEHNKIHVFNFECLAERRWQSKLVWSSESFESQPLTIATLEGKNGKPDIGFVGLFNNDLICFQT